MIERLVVASLFQRFLERNRRRNCRRPRRALPLSLSVSRSSFVRAEGGKERVEGKIGSIEIERQGRGRINGGGGGKGATRGHEKEGEKRGESRGERRARGQPLTIINRRA